MTERITKHDLDKYAEAYYLNTSSPDLFIEELIQHDVVDLVCNEIQDGDRVLEMGFGTGIVAPELLRRGIALEVVEGAPLLCEMARKSVPDLLIHEALFEEYSPEERFDVVLCLFILEHVDSPVEIITRAAEWLRPGGRLIAAVPNAESIHRRVAVDIGFQSKLSTLSARDGLVGHKRVFTVRQLTSDLNAAGLDVLSARGTFLKVVPNSLMTTWTPEIIESLCRTAHELPAEFAANIILTAENGPSGTRRPR